MKQEAIRFAVSVCKIVLRLTYAPIFAVLRLMEEVAYDFWQMVSELRKEVVR